MQEMPTSRPLVDGLMVAVTVHGVPADRAQIDGVVAATFVAHALISMAALLRTGGPISAAMRSRRLSWHDGNGRLAPRSEGSQPERPGDAGRL
eukprot:6731826-Lingulodinium_polyedra.AAC.1